MSGSGLLSGASRGSGIVLLLAALLVPATLAEHGNRDRETVPELAALVAPGAIPESPPERDTAGGPLLLLVAAGVVEGAVELPEPADARAAFGAADRLGSAAVPPYPPPPPRRA